MITPELAGQRLRVRREELDLSIDDVSGLTGLPATVLEQWEGYFPVSEWAEHGFLLASVLSMKDSWLATTGEWALSVANLKKAPRAVPRRRKQRSQAAAPADELRGTADAGFADTDPPSALDSVPGKRAVRSDKDLDDSAIPHIYLRAPSPLYFADATNEDDFDSGAVEATREAEKQSPQRLPSGLTSKEILDDLEINEIEDVARKHGITIAMIRRVVSNEGTERLLRFRSGQSKKVPPLAKNRRSPTRKDSELEGFTLGFVNRVLTAMKLVTNRLVVDRYGITDVQATRLWWRFGPKNENHRINSTVWLTPEDFTKICRALEIFSPQRTAQLLNVPLNVVARIQTLYPIATADMQSEPVTRQERDDDRSRHPADVPPGGEVEGERSERMDSDSEPR